MATDNLGSLWDNWRKEQPNPVPAGTYRFEVTSANVIDGKKGPRVNMTAKVVGGEQDGQKFWLPGQTLTRDSAGIFFQTFAGFGLAESFYRPLGEDMKLICEKTAEAVKGVVAEAPLVEAEYQGKPKNEYDGIGVVKYVGRRDESGIVQEAGTARPAPAAPAPQPPAAPEPPAPPAASNGTDVPTPEPVKTDEDVPF